MSKQNGKHRPDRMTPSTLDDRFLAEAVERKFLELCGTYLRVEYVELPIPQHLSPDIKRWREMRMRHKHNDFRNSDAELKSVKAVAEWLLEVNAKLRNQKTPKAPWQE